MARKSRKDAAALTTPKKAAMKIWRVALYIRLSVEFNGKKGDSLETQRQIMEAYIALCPDIEITEVYTDNGTTGRTFEREAFQRMLNENKRRFRTGSSIFQIIYDSLTNIATQGQADKFRSLRLHKLYSIFAPDNIFKFQISHITVTKTQVDNDE